LRPQSPFCFLLSQFLLFLSLLSLRPLSGFQRFPFQFQLFGVAPHDAHRTSSNLRSDPFPDIVLKHYFQPGREDFRQALHSAISRLLTNGHKTPKEEMRELIDAVKPKALRERLLKVWAKL
jgi:hypothetical protein